MTRKSATESRAAVIAIFAKRRTTMTFIDGYSIIQYPNENKILIILPQTMETLTNTLQDIRKRKRSLGSEEEAVLLLTIKAMYENGGKTG